MIVQVFSADHSSLNREKTEKKENPPQTPFAGQQHPLLLWLCSPGSIPRTQDAIPQQLGAHRAPLGQHQARGTAPSI